MKSKPKLLFVYNADGDIFSSLKDAIHKIVKPKTYGCNLCALTYGAVSMKKDWREFIKDLPYPVKFLHKDEFKVKYKGTASLPAAFINQGKELKEIITSKEMNKCKTLEDLEKLVKTKIKTLK